MAARYPTRRALTVHWTACGIMLVHAHSAPSLLGCCSCRFEFLAGDDVFLGAAAKAYAAEGQEWRRSYYLPTSADLAIMKMRLWLVRGVRWWGNATEWVGILQPLYASRTYGG